MRYATTARGGKTYFGLRRDLLPTPYSYFQSQGLKLSGGLEWKYANCPFCGATKALRVRIDSGGYRCTACHAHGRDILAFHMRKTGMPFIMAARDLGAWAEVC